MSTWIEVGTLADVQKRRKVVVDAAGVPVVVVAHEGSLHALANVCIHKERELHKGVVLNGRLVCPGHQWSFDLATGWEAVKQQCQPTFDVKVEDGVVWLDADSRKVHQAASVDQAGA